MKNFVLLTLRIGLNQSLGKVYNNTSIITRNIPAGKDTTFIKFNSIDFGTYIIFSKIALSSQQPSGGALLKLNVVGDGVGQHFIEEVPSISFTCNANVCGYAIISKQTDSISASYYSINGVTIASAELIAIRIK